MSITQPSFTPAFRLDEISRGAVGSTNPVKVAAVRAVLERAGCPARVEGLAVASGVADQPVGDAETIPQNPVGRARVGIGVHAKRRAARLESETSFLALISPA